MTEARTFTREEKYFRKEENLECEAIAQREGDRLLALGDLLGAEVAHRIAGRLRIRRNDLLEPFVVLLCLASLASGVLL